MPPVDNSAVANDQTGLNWKVMSDEPIASSNIRTANATTNQQLVDTINREAVQSGIALGREIMQGGVNLGRAVQARALRYIFDQSAEEAVAFSKEIAGDLSSKLADIEGLLSAGQQQEKTAVTTPPQTGTGGAFGSDAGSALLQQIVNAQTVIADALAKLAAK